MEATPDRHDAGDSKGYEAVASEFIRIRTGSTVGSAVVRSWAEALPRGSAVLDLGCGHGVPISDAIRQAGCALYGVDASPSMVAAFRQRFPAAPVECASVLESTFFGRTFDGVVAWGLLFLLEPPEQEHLIHEVARALRPGGRFLFTAPLQAVDWVDVLTGMPSRSLGAERYRQIIQEAGLVLTGEAVDEGENHYYLTEKP